jgi:hypothetical protein
MRANTSTAAAAAALALGLALGGCAATASPEYDARFGDSARAIKAQQLIDPAAPQRHAQQTPRSDGRTVVEAGARHVDTYRRPPPANVINIGVGGGSSSR